MATRIKFETLSDSEQLELIKIENLIEEYEDIVNYATYHPFNTLKARDKRVLINVDRQEASVVKAIRALHRELTEVGITVLQSTKKEFAVPGETEYKESSLTTNPLPEGLNKSNEILKVYSYSQFEKWRKQLEKKIPAIRDKYKGKLMVPLSVAYTRGHDKGMLDMGLKPLGAATMFQHSSILPRLRAVRLLQYLTDSLSDEMQLAVVEGMRQGEGTTQIAKRLRAVKNSPHHVVVPPKLDPKTGGVLRKGFEYDMSSKHYSEVVARSEVMTATNHGRVDAYTKSDNVESLEWMTAGDERVCEICEPLDRQVFKLGEANAEMPAHAMCRCTWAVHKYKDPNASKTEMQNNYRVDDAGKALNSAPLGFPSTPTEQGENFDRWIRHMAGRGITKKQVKAKLTEQLARTGARVRKGWSAASGEDMYTLHLIKNARFYAQRYTKKKLPPTGLYKTKVIDGNPKITGQSNFEKFAYRENKYKQTITISEAAIRDGSISETYLHETGHSVWNRLNVDTRLSWHNRTTKGIVGKKTVSNYANVNYMEDFAETYSYGLLNPQHVQSVAPERMRWMTKHIFKTPTQIKVPLTPPVKHTWGTLIPKNKYITEADLIKSKEYTKAVVALKKSISEGKSLTQSRDAFYKTMGVSKLKVDKALIKWTLHTNEPEAIWLKRAMANGAGNRKALADELKYLRGTNVAGRDIGFVDIRSKYFKYSGNTHKEFLTEKLYTQAYLEAINKNKITMARGVRGDVGSKLQKKIGKSTEIKLNTATSWSEDEKRAGFFATRHGENGVVLIKEVKSKNIFSSFWTNPELRAYGEGESIVTIKAVSTNVFVRVPIE